MLRILLLKFIGEAERALADFIEVVNLQPQNAHAYFGLGFTYKALKRYEEAADNFEKAQELEPHNPKLVVNFKKIFSVKYIQLCKPGMEKL
jgi:Flp pilus assembly protein TadD